MTIHGFFSVKFYHRGARAVDPDHSTPELIDHLLPVVNPCLNVSYVFEQITGQMWSRLPVFAVQNNLQRIRPHLSLQAVHPKK